VHATWLIVGKDLRVQLRNRSLFVLGFVAPLILSFVLNLVFGGTDDPDAPVTFDMGVVDLDEGDGAGNGFTGAVEALAETGLVDLSAYDDEIAARTAVDDGTVAAAWVIPEGFSSAVASGGAAELVVIGDVDATVTASFARAVAERYATDVGTATLAARIAVETGVGQPDESAAIAEEVASRPRLATLVPIGAASEGLDATTRLTAGLMLFFVFFTAGLPLLSILEERGQGTLARLLAAPIPSASITAGKAIATLVIGVASLVSLMAASTLLIGADWGPPVGAFVLAVAAVLAAIGIMSVAGAAARTPEQAGNVQAGVAVALGLIGGTFVPIPDAGSGLLAWLRLLTPQGWFIDGLDALHADGIGAALPAAAALLAMAIVTGALGLRLARTMLRR
jgi:ABC-2 type transport system permease protein